MESGDSQLAPRTWRSSVRVLLAALCVVVLVTLGAPTAVADTGTGSDTSVEEPVADAIIVDLEEGGDAVVTVTIPFDLTESDEQTDFEAFVESNEKQQEQLDQYESRLARVATELESQVDRDMAVTGSEITTQTTDGGELGLVVLEASWEGLAATDGDQLVVGPPFDSGFSAEQRLVLRPPAQHQVVATTPTPTSESDQLVWNSERTLDEFEVVIEPQDGETADDTDEADTDSGTADTDTATDSGDPDDDRDGDATGPGFGVFVAGLGVAVLGVWLAGRY